MDDPYCNEMWAKHVIILSLRLPKSCTINCLKKVIQSKAHWTPVSPGGGGPFDWRGALRLGAKRAWLWGGSTFHSRQSPRRPFNNYVDMILSSFDHLHWCHYIIATSLFLDIKWQFSRGREWGRVATPTSFSIFDSHDMKSLWFKFGHDIFTGFKMPRL